MIGGKTIMFDCGMHMGYHDDRRFPDFSLIPKRGDYTQSIDCIIITHFHLDHIGALPYFTEICGYEGPIFMTYPTKALAPLMLEDYRRVMVDRRGQQEQFSVLQIHDSMKKVTAVDLKQTISLGSDIQFRAYYAGHVLGAAMFHLKVGESTVVYTGDYNMTPDRHLGAAQIDRLKPDLIITESTYATTIRDSKHARERDFLQAVHKCVTNGGKVLIPVFALGRAQELCILLDDYWERMNLKAPIYFSAGLTMQANVYYKLLIAWTNQKVKDTCITRNTFDFKHVSVFDRSQLNAPGPCVLFATPGMLSGGLSLEVFRLWAPFEQNMVVVPGYCVPGTVGYRLVTGKTVTLDADKRIKLEVRCQIHHLSFSAHTDAKGIMDLLRHVSARHVILVHGEKPKMALLRTRIISELGVPCFVPGNGETVEVPSRLVLKVLASEKFLTKSQSNSLQTSIKSKVDDVSAPKRHMEDVSLSSIHDIRSAIIIMDKEKTIQVLNPEEALNVLNVSQHNFLYRCRLPLYISGMNDKDFNAPEVFDRGPTEGNEISGKELMKPSKKCCRGIQEFSGFQQQYDLEDKDAENELIWAERKEQENELELEDKGAENERIWAEHKEQEGIPHSVLEAMVQTVYKHLVKQLGDIVCYKQDNCIVANSVCIKISSEKTQSGTENKAQYIFTCTWSGQDEELARQIISILHMMQIASQASA
ncbi:hypothetical protein KP509_25G033800 [Ceratopteris richardii]|nr:hypothetical protein KP509_25G033800 [Ceratopteris richardii]